MKDTTVLFSVTLILTLVLTVLTLRRLIPYLKGKKMGQHILEIGPRWHKNKEGTPTMGGLSFLAASAVCAISAIVYMICRWNYEASSGLVSTFAFALVCGLIGVIDDFAKFTKKENEGLSAAQKYLLQFIASGAYLFMMVRSGYVGTSIDIPFTDFSFDLGVFSYIIYILIITGVVNSVNLTDGIDGLASAETAVVGIFWGVCAFTVFSGTLSAQTGVLSAMLIGSSVGFLVYNFYPARVFMGDTGSLFLGGLVVGTSFVAGKPIIALLCGFMYVLESISVILQVGYFKLTHGKRIFLMSPIHHHFEKKGWSEIKIVTVFGIFTLLFCILAYFGV